MRDAAVVLAQLAYSALVLHGQRLHVRCVAAVALLKVCELFMVQGSGIGGQGGQCLHVRRVASVVLLQVCGGRACRAAGRCVGAVSPELPRPAAGRQRH